jgi:hypothetical protein
LISTSVWSGLRPRNCAGCTNLAWKRGRLTHVVSRDDIDRSQALIGTVAGKARADHHHFLQGFRIVGREGDSGRRQAQAGDGQPE